MAPNRVLGWIWMVQPDHGDFILLAEQVYHDQLIILTISNAIYFIKMNFIQFILLVMKLIQELMLLHQILLQGFLLGKKSLMNYFFMLIYLKKTKNYQIEFC